jgi:hypothetical protein
VYPCTKLRNYLQSHDSDLTLGRVQPSETTIIIFQCTFDELISHQQDIYADGRAKYARLSFMIGVS